MILIDSILMDEAIIHDHFACDVHACKGACCTLKGGEGAPLKHEEISMIQSAIPFAMKYVSEQSRAIIANQQWIGGTELDPFVQCIDDADCVFVCKEDGIAKCALEKAYHEGKTTFRKPISCHLFPIRVRNFGGDYLSYQPFEECTPAFDHGKHNNIVVLDAVKDALIRAFGEQWYDQAKEMKTQEEQ
ncbi:MAG: DUF3109 family protein [Ignavibacteria bacterium]